MSTFDQRWFTMPVKKEAVFTSNEIALPQRIRAFEREKGKNERSLANIRPYKYMTRLAPV